MTILVPAALILTLVHTPVVAPVPSLPAPRATTLRDAIARAHPVAAPARQYGRQPFTPRSSSSVGRKIGYGAAGALVGFLAGGAIGGALDSHCACDDPGLAGFVYGGFTGAVGGAILGVLLAR